MGEAEREASRLAPASAPGGHRPEREAGGGIYLRIIRGDIAKSRGTTLAVDLPQTEDIPGKAAAIEAAMGGDRAIARFAAFTTKTFMVRPASGPDERIMVELGDHRAFPVEYSSGGAPLTSGEIALSAINARELGKRVGDSLVLSAGGAPRRLLVCGVYSDVTNGGKTAKASFEDDSAEVMWCVLCASLAPGADAGKKAAEYARRFEYAKVSDIGRYIAQTFGSTMESARKACGFTNRDIAAQYLARPLMMAASVLAATAAGVAGGGRVKIPENIKE